MDEKNDPKDPQSNDPTTTFGAIPDDIEGGPYRPTPEDFLPTAQKPKGPLTGYPYLHHGQPAVFLWVLFFCVSAIYWNRPEGALFPASYDTVVNKGEIWRLVTALFTHSDLGHLAANTPLFLIFGWYLRAFFGRISFPIMAFIIGAVSNLATISVYGGTSRLVGASGMVYGMVALWLVLYIRHDVDRPMTVRVVRAIAFALIVMFPTTFQPQTSYLAHAFGFAFGLAAGIALMNFVTPEANVPDVDPKDPDDFDDGPLVIRRFGVRPPRFRARRRNLLH